MADGCCELTRNSNPAVTCLRKQGNYITPWQTDRSAVLLAFSNTNITGRQVTLHWRLSVTRWHPNAYVHPTPSML